MTSKETPKERAARVARELGPAIRRQARGQWKDVRMAQRREKSRHVWRFRSAPDGGERFLHIEYRSMARGNDAAERLLGQLTSEDWLDRLQNGPEKALLLSTEGQLVALPRA